MNDDTLPAGRTSSPNMAPVELTGRYELRGTLGRGGMGEVRLARDMHIEREVAIKLMHPQQRDEATIARFFREARVQGQLEHPAVVPVHDLGVDRSGNPYFVMKRLAGTTLADAMMSPERWPRRQLLARLVDVCFAIEFAHTRGVVHRDLKPANIMLGDFGEAYVLDWGLARIIGDSAPAFSAGLPLAAPDGDSGATLPGQILGTPGYMSPEQIRGDIDSATDVYALGCILFEILVGKPALPRGVAALEVTISTECHRPSERDTATHVPLELDDLCARATANDRTKRPSARALATGLQAYLDGDRDLERRRELATHHAALASAAFYTPGDEARAVAMREAGRAFTLDATNATAHTILGRLLLEAPTEIPAAAVAAAERERGFTRQTLLRLASMVFALSAVLPFALFVLSVNESWPLIAMSATLGSLSLACWGSSRQIVAMRGGWFFVILLLSTALLVITGIIFGPLLVLPTFVIGSLAAWFVQPARSEIPYIVIAHVLAFGPLLVLELTGVTPSTFEFTHAGLLLKPWALGLTSRAAGGVLAVAYAAQFFNAVVIAYAGWRSQEAAQIRVHAQTWHLQQLAPPRPEA